MSWKLCNNLAIDGYPDSTMLTFGMCNERQLGFESCTRDLMNVEADFLKLSWMRNGTHRGIGFLAISDPSV